MWQCDVGVSWRTQWISLLIHGVLILIILMSPWPEDYILFWLMLLVLVVFEWTRSQKRIASRKGELRLLPKNRLEWHGEEWLIRKKPWLTRWGFWLPVQHIDGKKSARIWLASDALSEAHWHELRQKLLYPSAAADEYE